MKLKISLRLYILAALILLGISLIVGYSQLAANYFILGMDNMLANNLRDAATRYVRANPSEAFDEPGQLDEYYLSSRWQTLPSAITELFPEPPEKPETLYKHDSSGFLEPPDRVTFVLQTATAGPVPLYVARTYTVGDLPEEGRRQAGRSFFWLTVIGIVVGAGIIAILLAMLRSVTRPVEALGLWAAGLDAGRLQQQPPDFRYPELNQLAGLIRNSLLSVHQALDREHSFLRHTSHELRTPIAVIRNNIELLNRLQPHPDAREKQVIGRIERASLTMSHLTETLLWLSRDDDETLPQQPVELDKLISELVEELRYLLADKSVQLELGTEASVVSIPPVSGRIVLGNLIRNAFQHTWEGNVEIRQQGSRITIINTQDNTEFEQQDLGFGLGLELTRRLTARLHWPYENIAGPSGHRVVLELK